MDKTQAGALKGIKQEPEVCFRHELDTGGVWLRAERMQRGKVLGTPATFSTLAGLAASSGAVYRWDKSIHSHDSLSTRPEPGTASGAEMSALLPLCLTPVPWRPHLSP